MKVLVTAFKPFNNLNNNYSTEVLNHLNGVDKIILDVVYDKCYNDLMTKFKLDDYDLIIALGEARMRNELTLELQAKNISSCSLADNSGTIKTNEIIDNNLEEVIKTHVLLQELDKLVKFSNDAGKFVCNNLYFHLLANYPDKSIFIHIPNCYDSDTEYIKHSLTINKIIKTIESRGK